MITAVSVSNNGVTPQVDLHALRAVSKRGKYGLDLKATGQNGKNRLFKNGSVHADQIPPALAARAKILTRGSGEERAYFAYSSAPKIFRKLADYCEFGEGPRDYAFKNRIINFLEDRKEFQGSGKCNFFPV